MNKPEVIKHVTIRNNKTLKDDQPSPTIKNQKLVVNDTSNASNPMKSHIITTLQKISVPQIIVPVY